jgi:hypothetical protein
MKTILNIALLTSLLTTAIFSQNDSSTTRKNLLIAVNFGTIELINVATDFHIFSGAYFQLKAGKNFILHNNDFLPNLADQYSFGLVWKLLSKPITPIVSANYGIAAWKVSESLPAYLSYHPPESAKIVILLIGVELSASNNIVGGVNWGKIYFNHSNGETYDKSGIQGYVGFSIW